MNKVKVIALFFAVQLWAAVPTLVNNQWVAAPNTKLADVAPTNGQFPYTWGNEGPSAVFADWAGAAFDYQKGRMFATGGGHCGYYGNEMYMFAVDSCKWTRLTNPTVLYPGYGCTGDQSEVLIDTASNDTTPQARHTYSGTCYIQHAEKFFMVSRGYVRTYKDSAFKPDSITWIFDPATKRWEHRYPVSNIGTIPKRSIGDLSIYDSVSKMVYYHGFSDGGASLPGWFKYDYEANTWTRINQDDGSSAVGCLDTKRRLIIENKNNNQLVAWDIANGFTGSSWTTIRAGNALNNWCADNCVRAIDYDRINDRYVSWYENSDTVFVLDPVTKVWDTYYATHQLGTTNQGIYNRFRYVPSIGAFMAAANINNNVHFFKLKIPLHQDTFAMTSLDAHAAAFSVEQYQTIPLTYTATFADGITDTVTWGCFFSSLDTAIATISQEGKVYGKRVGTARIVAKKITRQTTLSDTVNIAVLPTSATIDSIRLELSSVKLLNVRDSLLLKGTVYAHVNTQNITWPIDTAANWTTSNSAIAIVNEGLVNGVSEGGPVNIIVNQGGKADTCVVTIMPNPTYIKRINFQNPSLPIPLGWAAQSYFSLYNAGVGYGWVSYPDDNNRITAGSNFLLQTRMISYSGTNFKINVPAGDYIIKTGMGDIAPYYGGNNWLVYGTDTLMKWDSKTNEAGIEIDTITVTGTSGLTLKFKGYWCYLIIISKEGIDINEIAEDGGLVDNINYGCSTASEGNKTIDDLSLTVNPSPFNPSTSLSFSIPKGTQKGFISIFTHNGTLVKTFALKNSRGNIIWDGRNSHGESLPSGSYIVKLTAGKMVINKQAVLIK
ncbi:MAG: Ig-like domain-containing protein [Fibrobacteres bacterium]|nr:Ig-like domain-containing protein [Fibrobacterota bacterium]